MNADHKALIEKTMETATRLKNAMKLAEAENNWERAEYISILYHVFIGEPVQCISVSQWDEAYEILEILYPNA